jgi:hypothetical protein
MYSLSQIKLYSYISYHVHTYWHNTFSFTDLINYYLTIYSFLILNTIEYLGGNIDICEKNTFYHTFTTNSFVMLKKLIHLNR